MKVSLKNLTYMLMGIIFSLYPRGEAAAWTPSKPVEFWVTFGQNAHADIWAREVSRLVEKYQLSPVPFEVVNIPKGVGVEAFPKFAARAGDDHTIMLILPNVFTVPLFKDVPFDITQMTPVAGMGEEPLALWVKSANEEVANIDDLVRQARAKGKDFVFAGPPLGTPRALLCEMVIELYGLNATYTGIPKIGSTAKYLAENDIDAAIHNPAEQSKIDAPDAIKPIAMLSKRRIPAFVELPTLNENGMPIIYVPSRTVIGPPGMSEEARGFYENVIRQVFETPEWQTLREEKGHVGEYLASEALGEYLIERMAKHERWKATIEELRRVPVLEPTDVVTPDNQAQ
ncbi:MAG: hypothetical protein KTR21_16440 [Rhodobacteraceae bacterium]|nr:hypothetical protein [Paracoccaceae bacterium]